MCVCVCVCMFCGGVNQGNHGNIVSINTFKYTKYECRAQFIHWHTKVLTSGTCIIIMLRNEQLLRSKDAMACPSFLCDVYVMHVYSLYLHANVMYIVPLIMTIDTQRNSLSYNVLGSHRRRRLLTLYHIEGLSLAS